MQFLTTLQSSQPVAYTIITLSAVAVLGLAIGSIKIRGISLGIAGVLFAGIILGHFQFHIDPGTLAFVRDMGLVVFVYTIGIQVGPGFIASLRRGGLALNLMSTSIVLMGAGITLIIARLGQIDIATALGIFAGATTNTPALGAAQEALHTIPGISAGRLETTALGYAAAYPFGVVGIILAMLVLRAIFRVRMQDELTAAQQSLRMDNSPLIRQSFVIENRKLHGLMVRDVPQLHDLGITISRIQRPGASETFVALPESILELGDLIMAVGSESHLEQAQAVFGSRVSINLLELPGPIVFQRVLVTNKKVVGRALGRLDLEHQYGVIVTRIVRADIELSPSPDTRLAFGDSVRVVGNQSNVSKAAEALGNSIKALNHTNFIPVFIGLGIGVLIGLCPLRLGSMPVPVRLGLAGGPLITAIIFSRLGRIGPIVWQMPPTANAALREFGIILFLSCVGLKAGEHFVAVLIHGSGLTWMADGALITIIPLLAAGAFARLVLKQNFMNICGMLAGSMTDPPALAFANGIAGSDIPSVAYATVYPLSMVLRIVTVQVIALLFCR